MKKNIILIFVLTFSIPKNTNAQFESIFGEINTKWEILTGFCDSWCSNTFTITGDTLINSNVYKITTDNSQLVFLREDTLLGKVWYYDSDQNNEYLLMDLNLSVGDTFEIFNDISTQTEYYSVDSVYYFNNKKHIRLLNFTNLCTPNDFQIVFIEGVGSSSGLTYKNQSYKNQIVLCQTKNVVTDSIYNHYFQGYFSFLGTCDYCVSRTTELFTPTDFTIFPNPFIDRINLSSNHYSINYEIYDVVGRLIKSENTNERVYTVNTEDLQEGVYILVLKHENRILVSRKLIKNKE